MINIGKIIWNILKPLLLLSAYLAYDFKGVFWVMIIFVLPSFLAHCLLSVLAGWMSLYAKPEHIEKMVITMNGKKYGLIEKNDSK